MAEIGQESISALHVLRTWAKGGNVSGADAAKAVDVLDNAGVFAAIDTATDYDLDAPDLTAGGLDPAEWGDTTRADMARHQSAPMPTDSLADQLLSDKDGRF